MGLTNRAASRDAATSRLDSTIVIIGILTIILGAIGAAITAFMG